jgi:hypothetical protein
MGDEPGNQGREGDRDNRRRGEPRRESKTEKDDTEGQRERQKKTQRDRQTDRERGRSDHGLSGQEALDVEVAAAAVEGIDHQLKALDGHHGLQPQLRLG